MAEATYFVTDIQVLAPMEAVRRRPGMYVGDVETGAGMHVALWEVISNAIEEHRCGHARRVRVTFAGARVTVEDDGRGIPPEVIERLLTNLHAGTGWRREHVHLAAGMHGVGFAITNALAAELEVTIWRDGYEYVQRFERGEPRGPVARVAGSSRHGTRISFTPDFTIFPRRPWQTREIAGRLRTLAGVMPGLVVEIDGERWEYARLAAYVEDRAGCAVIDPFMFRTRVDDVAIELALAWRCQTASFETLVNCSPGTGVHVDAMFAGLRAALAPRLPRLTRRQLARGMVGVLHVELEHPRFGTPSRDWLVNPEVAAAVRDVVERELVRHLDEVPAFVDALVLDLARRVRVRGDGRRSEAPLRETVRG